MKSGIGRPQLFQLLSDQQEFQKKYLQNFFKVLNFPKMSTERLNTRNIPTVRAYDPNVSTTGPVIASVDNTASWTFFETEGSLIGHDIVAKRALNPHHRCDFVYLGKRNKSGGVTVVRFSLYEGSLLRKFLARILDEIALYIESGQTDVIPFFQDSPERVFDSIRPEHRVAFWSNSDVELESVRGRVTFNRIHGGYELILNCPVSAEVTKKLKGWVGPTLYFSYTAMKDLESYLIKVATAAVEKQAE